MPIMLHKKSNYKLMIINTEYLTRKHFIINIVGCRIRKINSALYSLRGESPMPRLYYRLSKGEQYNVNVNIQIK